MSECVGVVQRLRGKCLNMFWDCLGDCGLFPGYWGLFRNGDAYASFLITADEKEC